MTAGHLVSPYASFGHKPLFRFLWRAINDQNVNAEEFTSIGTYAPLDAERLLDALQRANVAFQIECDDGIRSSYVGPSFGQNGKVRVFVDRDKVIEAKKVQQQLFGEPT